MIELLEAVVICPEEKNIDLNFDKLVSFIRTETRLSTKIEPLRIKNGSLKKTAEGFAGCRIKEARFKITDMDLDYELRYLRGKIAASILYDGFRLSLKYQDLIKDNDDKKAHIVITNRLIATYDDARKLHIRSIVLSRPTIISLSGIVEGPAKPKEFYAIKHRLAALGLWQQNEPLVKKKFKKKFIDYEDKRIIEIVKGLILQAIVFIVTGQAFCKVRGCRLFNAHWQKDLMYSQIKSAKLCTKHRKIINLVKKQLNERNLS